MTSIVLFAAVSALFVWISRHALRKPDSHGFYRFFAWECILALVLINFPVWTVDPFAPHQLVSWTLLAVSVFLVVDGLRLLRREGRPGAARTDAELLSFERTSQLVTSGTYRYIRHPMYASLILLAWGAFFKQASWTGAALASGASVALLLTALRDEAECIAHFGEAYAAYMGTSKRFVPFLV
ncbi:methyltransferase family protein [Piscinibacter gummiphilus]|uniref:Isoprenylcysteine carboxyl methyltransferase n=1 Tax=Piscinibacter gummiphilus TaxID=946333 RepID=A0A1W6L4B6_9BURK|nr:methyltransferase [Piscinibacter gummiphilus]ARN19093.1 isoprenylcysteine carboxyl methyltransferase [Piscinibacter gummiphilus]ATU63743.1 isoprenylcysteine carboxylmethyltransferase family protein [Piscinibacter gummiphilus]GLS93322.1 hypothetical protein GCM10007918_06130 [Piscinibacter gummiphilus]